MTRRLRHALTASVFVLAGAAIGCNGGAGGPPAKDAGGGTVKTGDGKVVSQAAANAFNEGVASMSQHDAANDWTDAHCESTAAKFKKANDEQQGIFFEALYNAGVAYQRCKNDAAAKQIFSDILSKKSDFHRARVQVALYEYAADGDVEKAMGQMEQAIKDAEFKNEEALVNLAILEMTRDSSTGGQGCDNDFDCAKLNLQRALAINDGFMPAFNQLAVYYLESAKKKAGQVKGKGRVAAAAGKKKKADSQALELAALVVSQALRKNPKYAPVHNTSGLISAELGDLSAAARAFGTARQLDPKFFEAHMNYAAVNLQFRGFKQAEAAYREAIKLKPNDYEAHLGLALAVRGLIDPTNFDKNLKEADELLTKAKSLAPDRPETYYNQAILTQEFKARGNTEGPLLEAKKLFSEFTSKAGSDESYAAAVKVANERMEEIDQIIAFNKQSAEDQKRMEAMRRAQEAKEQLEKNAK
ncbi:MAG: hypothetical protein R3B72_14445 [Polyangiaceae bacterium]